MAITSGQTDNQARDSVTRTAFWYNETDRESRYLQTCLETAQIVMKIRSILQWLDDHILLLLSSFLIAFIPLYPKLPLFEAIPGYIVRVRLEDILILVTMIIWFVQVVRKKIEWKTPLTFAIVLYAIVGLLSTASAVLFTKTIPAEMLHIGKSLLHYFRYLEYFCLLFVAYASIKTVKHLKIMLAIITITVVAITIYGFGQRFLYWPVYSTMNREFSKGIRLYLTEHARVQSTFGGHYDLAAYLVIVTPLLLSGFYLFKKRLLKWLMFIVFLAAYWLIIATASRTSYASFFLAIGTVIALSAIIVKKTLISRLFWALRQYLIIGIISIVMLINFGYSMYERLLQTLEAYPTVYKPYTEVVKQGVQVRTVVVDAFISQENLQKLSNTLRGLKNETPPENSLSVEEAAVLVSSDTQPSTGVPSDVYVNVPTYETVATISAEGVVTETVVPKDRTYSETAQTHGLSFAIRLDTLWPRAIQGFYKNPLLGSGYATLTKETVGQFTEAESTDNNFLRTLGETGLLGFITFYGTVILAGFVAFKLFLKKNLDTIAYVFVVSYLAATVGILLNAVFIDVFASSKVAFSFWALTGILLAIQALYGQNYFSFDFLARYFSPNSDNSLKPAATVRKRKKN